MAIDSQTRPGDKGVHVEISESPFGPFGIDGVLSDIIDPESLPSTLQERLHVRAAIVKVVRTSLPQREKLFQSPIWLVLLPRSRGQDLGEDFLGPRRKETFPVVVYGYSGSVVERPLVMEQMYDIGLGYIELSD